MLELIIFLILAFFTYVLISSLVFKIKGGNLGCISSIITLFITFIICVPLSEKLNPYKAESFFNKETIIKNGLPLPHRDMLPVMLEEQLICYADKFYSKSQLKETHSLERIRTQLGHFGQSQVAKFDAWHTLFER